MKLYGVNECVVPDIHNLFTKWSQCVASSCDHISTRERGFTVSWIWSILLILYHSIYK